MVQLATEAELAALQGSVAGTVVPRGGPSLAAYLANNAVFNVKDFGAKGDGVTDDTVAIDAAIDACAAVFGKLLFPSGTYIVPTGPLHALGSHCAVEYRGLIMVAGVETLLSTVGIQDDNFRGVGYYLKQLYVGQSAGFMSIPSPAPGVGLGDAFSILVGVGNTVNITDNFWKEGIHCANVGYKTSAAFTGVAVEGVEGEARVGALNTQNWTGYSPSGGQTVACIGVTGTVATEFGSTGTITGIANFWTQSFFMGAAVPTWWYGYYAGNPSVTGTAPQNAVGVYIEPINVGTITNYAVYAKGGASFFQDGIFVGVLPTVAVGGPAIVLDVEKALTAVAPATSGTTQSNGGRIRIGSATSGTAIVDFGVAGGAGGWIQSASSANLATNFPLSINPNGGGVGLNEMGTTTSGLHLKHSSIPTSSAGLVSGDVWSNAGVLTMV